MEVIVGGVVMVRGHLQARVEADTWTWTLGGGKLGLMMTKVMIMIGLGVDRVKPWSAVSIDSGFA